MLYLLLLFADGLPGIDAVVEKTIKAGKCPGAVVLVTRGGKVVHRKAYGLRAVKPAREAMTLDTIFDLASLTKPMATAAAIHLLAKRGKLSLDDAVSRHFPAFKGEATLSHLLLHTSGLPAGNPVSAYKAGRSRAVATICGLKRSPVGGRFVYSDLGYILLGEIAAKVAGEPLDSFCKREFYAPLGMKDTGFLPPKEVRSRIAPTEGVRGVVHDPRARALGGVAGHAGLFGTADDIARFAQMLLDGGKKGVMDGATVKAYITPHKVPRGLRTLGWDARTAYSGNRGELFAGFGHTGFTGTSVWIDPPTGSVVVILTNRVHPDGKGDVRALRRDVATRAARAVKTAPPRK